jgi:hypothetical protein
MGEKRNVYGYLWESQEERDHQEDPDVGGRIILKRIIQGLGLMIWTGYIWLRIGASGWLL